MNQEKYKILGKVISVNGPVVDVEFGQEDKIPNLYAKLETKNSKGESIFLEILEHKDGNIARCVALSSTLNLEYQASVSQVSKFLTVPVGNGLLGRIINANGEAIDNLGKIQADEYVSVRKNLSQSFLRPDKISQNKFELLETGIKIIDLFFPMIKGSKTGLIGGAALGKSILILEIMHNIIQKHKGKCVFTGAGERSREANELYYELIKQNILDKAILAFGQMNEPPGARFDVAFTGITLAEYLKNQNNDVLFFIDNVYRFVQAGAEISTLLGRVPSETGYQSTLSSEVSEFHERIISDSVGSITAIEAVYVPADDITDLAVATILGHLDSIMVLSREKIQLGLYPAIDPLLSSSSNLDSMIVGNKHFEIAQKCLEILAKYEKLKKIVMVIGLEELSQTDKLLYNRARKLLNFLTQPFFVAEIYTGKDGKYVKIEETIEGCSKIISGELDSIAEEKLYMIGSII